MSIPDALRDLYDGLSYTDDRERLLHEIAAEYELHPELLRRKFREQHGVSLEDWTPPTNLTQASRASAQEKAIKEAKTFWTKIDCYECDLDPGFLFTLEGKEFALINIGLKKEISAIRVIDQEKLTFKFRNESHAEAVEWLKRNATDAEEY